MSDLIDRLNALADEYADPTSAPDSDATVVAFRDAAARIEQQDTNAAGMRAAYEATQVALEERDAVIAAIRAGVDEWEASGDDETLVNIVIDPALKSLTAITNTERQPHE